MTTIGVPIPIDDLFTPAASGVGTNPNLPPAAGTWLAIMLQVATALGLPTTSWAPGGVERTLIALMATAFAQQDGITSIMIQGGFLDYAATGSVTYVAANGLTVTQPVTPDPSDVSQNPLGLPGWLDALASSVYNVTRLPASYATGPLAIANTTASPIGPYTAGTYHVSNPQTNASYANLASLTIPSSQIAGSGGVVSGASGTTVVTINTVAPHGLSNGQTVYVPGLLGLTLSQTFAQIVVTGSNSLQLANVTGSGSWTSGGTVYLCTVATFAADVVGAGSTSGPNGITNTVTQNNGVFVDNTSSIVGDNWESNVKLAARCRLKLQSLSPNGPSGAYKYFALSSSELLADETPSITLRGGAITKAIVSADPSTGIVTTTIANDSPASTTLGQPVVEGASNLAVAGTGSGVGGAVQLTVASTVGLTSADFATVAGIIGTTEANGTWQITVDDSTHITLVGTVFANAYVSGGTVEAGDLGQVDRIIQENSVGDDDISQTKSATAFPITIAATVVVPSSQASAYAAKAQTAIANYVAAIDIGGLVLPGASVGIVDWSALEGALFGAGSVNGQPSYVQGVQSLTIDGGTGPVSTDVSFPLPTSEATLTAFVLTVVKS